MLFNSGTFVFVFLPLTLLGFFLLGAKGWVRAAKAWLVISSAVFYGWFRFDYLFLLGGLIVFNYLWGIRLSRARRQERSRRIELTIGICANLCVLGFFKYTNFALDNIAALTGRGFDAIEILLPIGISFFTFQSIAYLIDAYRGVSEEYDPLDFSLFIMFFPQLIAGPIVHHKEMIPQFREPTVGRFVGADLACGLTLFAMGLLKKVGIADVLSRRADPLFAAADAGDVLTFVDAWSAALFFNFQIYFDFSAYSDMALGLALMIGIRLPLNFDSPYKASSIIEFWRRWHMTLSRFLRDYLYFPLGGNRHGKVRRYTNLMVTMLLGGLWHGASWTFVIWGGLHGLYLVLNHGWIAARHRLALPELPGAVGVCLGRVATFLAVVVAWVFFRAEEVSTAMSILAGMGGWNGAGVSVQALTNLGGLSASSQDFQTNVWHILAVIALVPFVWLLPNSQEILGRMRPALQQVEGATLRGVSKRVASALGFVGRDGSFSLSATTGLLVAGVILSVMAYQDVRVAVLKQFIYFQF